jgi:CheY-like chemotaxis protein
MRLLIVDDEPSILELLGVALKALGTYKVKTATSAKQALQMIEGKPREFDAFLLDIQMPEMNGIDLCAEIRPQRALQERADPDAHRDVADELRREGL